MAVDLREINQQFSQEIDRLEAEIDRLRKENELYRLELETSGNGKLIPIKRNYDMKKALAAAKAEVRVLRRQVSDLSRVNELMRGDRPKKSSVLDKFEEPKEDDKPKPVKNIVIRQKKTKIEDTFEKVRVFLSGHPNSLKSEIIQSTGISDSTLTVVLSKFSGKIKNIRDPDNGRRRLYSMNVD